MSVCLIQPDHCLILGDLKLTVQNYLGQFGDVLYYQAQEHLLDRDPLPRLLRVGKSEGCLALELTARKTLGAYRLIAPLLLEICLESLHLRTSPPWRGEKTHSEADADQEVPPSDPPAEDKQNLSGETITDLTPLPIQEECFLEDEYIPEQLTDLCYELGILLITDYPDPAETLSTHTANSPNLLAALNQTIQVCQLTRYLLQNGWCLYHIHPDYLTLGTLIRCYDLVGIHPVNQSLATNLMGMYCPPELAYGSPVVSEQTSTHLLGQILQALTEGFQSLPIPLMHQILTLSLQPTPSDRLKLDQLQSLLIEFRNHCQTPLITWATAVRSVLGLSIHRLQNEDAYGLRHRQHTQGHRILALVADGMGGMSQGEEASRIAVETLLNTPDELNKNPQEWLYSSFQSANLSIANAIDNGGTTLSAVLIDNSTLYLAHVGDSRIYLIRNGILCQLSQDHSLVTMLLASGTITYQESLRHPDRNVLIRSLGSQRTLANGYVQSLEIYGDSTLALQSHDVLLLCTDGVWDYVTPDEFANIFNQLGSLQSKVDEIIKLVLKRGSADNATMIAIMYENFPSFIS